MAILLVNVKFGGAIITKGTEITKDHAGYKYLLKHTDEHDPSVPQPKWQGEPVKDIDPNHAAAAAQKDANTAEAKNNAPAPADANNPADPYADLTNADIKKLITDLGVEIPKDVKTKAALIALLEKTQAEQATAPAPADANNPADPEQTGDALGNMPPATE